MRRLQWELKQICERNRDGSYGTQTQRSYQLASIAEDLWQAGFRDLHADGIKGRHVTRLLRVWQEKGLSTGSVKNKMAALRWWAEKVGHGHMIPPRNASLGIPNREGVCRQSKAITIPIEIRLAIRDRHVRMSVEMQRVFGLRREEAIKFSPSYADRGDYIVLKPSWCKGGRGREIPILTKEQRVILDQVHGLVRNGSLIPDGKNYKQQLRTYESEMRRLHIYRPHGLRHKYAQDRYETLSGQPAPVNGGLMHSTAGQYEADHQARLQVSRELGHARKSISGAYLGAVRRAKKK